MFSLNPSVVEIEKFEAHSLLERAQAGDTEAFCELCRAYETRLLRQALTLCGNVTVAEELSQDTLVEAWKCLRRYHGRCQFFTWLCAILLNRYRNSLRRKRPVALALLAAHERDAFQKGLEQLTAQEFPPDDAAQRREQAALVLECISELPARHQQVIYLRFYVGDSFAGIAEALGCSVGTVKSRLFRALDKLRRMNVLHEQFANLETKVASL